MAAYLGMEPVITCNGDVETDPYARCQPVDCGEVYIPQTGEPDPFPWSANKIKFGFTLNEKLVGRGAEK